jgi:hypothetical protein
MECNHLLGICIDFDNRCDYWFHQNDKRITDNYSPREPDEVFKFCPNCGIKLPITKEKE